MGIDNGIFDVSLDIKPGECVLVCGPSGCGKTTLTRLINGLVPHFFQGDFSGRVTVAGLCVPNTPLYQIACHVGSVFQNPRTQFFNVDTDGEIAFSLENAGVSPELIRQRLGQTTRDLNIGSLRQRSLFELSGGGKQKIAFASAYAFNPPVFVLDEPCANLDPASIRTLENYLGLLKKQGKTIIIAEHRLYYLMGLADRVIYMENGKIAAQYSLKQFKAIPAATLSSMGLRSRTPGKACPRLLPKISRPAPEKLVVDSMTARYKKTDLFKDIRLTARTGEIIGLIGSNGAGKSTFIRTLAGLHKKQSAQIFWKGLPASKRKRLGASYLVMQDPGFQLFAESVTNECMFGLKHPDTDLIEKTLERLELDRLGQRHPPYPFRGAETAAGHCCGHGLRQRDPFV